MASVGSAPRIKVAPVDSVDTENDAVANVLQLALPVGPAKPRIPEPVASGWFGLANRNSDRERIGTAPQVVSRFGNQNVGARAPTATGQTVGRGWIVAEQGGIGEELDIGHR